MSRFTAPLLIFLACSAWPALSADRPPCTSTPTCWPDVQIPYRHADEMPDIDPVTGLSTSTVVRPLQPVPGAKPVPIAPAAPGAPARPATRTQPHIALILPTLSPTLGPLAEAVRLGFTTAAQVAGSDAPTVIAAAVDNEGAPMLEACKQAQAGGAFLVVAGLTRDGAQALARSDCVRQPVLALNEPIGGQVTEANLPANLFHASLSVEHEARQVAHLAVSDGRRSAIVVVQPSPLARRVQEAFEREWTRVGGELRRLPFSGVPEDAPVLRERLAGLRGDMVFVALGPDETRAVRPYVSAMLPMYATSFSVNPRADPVVNVDLQGIRYMEMPWFVQPDHPAVMAYPQKSDWSVDQERLYAYGIDAFRMALAMAKGDAGRIALDGVTGKIGLESSVRGFVRALVPAEVDGGRVVPGKSGP